MTQPNLRTVTREQLVELLWQANSDQGWGDAIDTINRMADAAYAAALPAKPGDEALCGCGHDESEHVHYCSHETRTTPQCDCNAEYARLREGPAMTQPDPESGLRAALERLRGYEDSVSRFSRDPIGRVVRLGDALALLGLAHAWPPDATTEGRGICADCGEWWPCQFASAAGAALSVREAQP